MISAPIVDDHPAVLSGLLSAMRSEPGIVPLATAAHVREALEMTERRGPDPALVDAMRTVAHGGKVLPALRRDFVQRAVSRLEPEDLPIVGMRIGGATVPEIAAVLQFEERQVSRRIGAIVERLAGLAADLGGATR